MKIINDRIKNKLSKLALLIAPVKKPEWDNVWTTLYFGARGSGKSLHQADMTIKTLEYLTDLYDKSPELKRAIVYSNQILSKKYMEKYKDYYYMWENFRETRYCPRKKCWKGEMKHRLHGCYLVFDDIATILPADSWRDLPIWARKNFSQGRHFGIRVIANCQDPFSVDINFRRYVDVCYRFRKICGSRDPDETKPPVKRIWGWYMRRRINADDLWKIGDVTETEIQAMKEKEAQDENVKKIYGNMWVGSIHLINRYKCEIYDTTQDVKEFKPEGFLHYEIKCTDPSCDHKNKKAPNYCGYKKVIHELI